MPTFQLEFADGSTERFDSDSSTFFSGEKAIHIEPFLPHVREHDNDDNYGPDGLKKSRTPRFVRIVFGFACNMRCKYCSQANTDKKAGTSVAEAEAFAQRFCSAIEGEPRKIELWGGEPLVYLRHMQAVLPILRSRFPTTRFGIITNGTLVSRDAVDLVDKYDMSVVISHDGPGQYIRGEDILEEPEKVALWREVYELAKRKGIERRHSIGFAFSSTLTRESHDIDAVARSIRSRFADDVPLFFDYVTAMGGIESGTGYQSTAFREEDLPEVEASVYAHLQRPEDTWAVNCRTDACGMLRRAMYHEPAGTSTCGSDGSDVLFVRTTGDILQCQNNVAEPGKYGSVFDLERARVTGATRWRDRPTCARCPFSGLCKGTCPYMSGDAFAGSCHVKRAYYKAVFRWVVEHIYKRRLVAIRGDMLFPERELVQTPHGKAVAVDRVAFYG